jgi:hypothetical protein
MPTEEAIKQAVKQLEAQGENISIEAVRALIGGSPRDIAPLLRQLRAEAAPAAAAPAAALPLTLAQIRQAARACRLNHWACDPQEVLAEINRDRPYAQRVVEADLWAVLPPHSDAEAAVLTWHVDVLRAGKLRWVQGNEMRILAGLWQREVTDHVGVITEQEQQAHDRDAWEQIAQARRRGKWHMQ